MSENLTLQSEENQQFNSIHESTHRLLGSSIVRAKYIILLYQIHAQNKNFPKKIIMCNKYKLKTVLQFTSSHDI